MKALFRPTVLGAVCSMAILAMPAVAHADAGITVTLSGRVVCGKIPPQLPGPAYLVQRVRFQPANGEASDATSILGVPPLLSYVATLKNVPASGEKVEAYITCGDSDQWGTEFQLAGGQSDQTVDLDRCTLDLQGPVPATCK